MKNYHDLLKDITSNGIRKSNRTGVDTLSVFGRTLWFNLSNGFPLLTTRKMFVRGLIEELVFLLNGKTDTKELEGLGVNIWKGNTSREFLDSRGLQETPEGEMGPTYGFQIRKFGGTHRPFGKSYGGVDQLKEVVDTIKRDPYNRRMVISLWHPGQLPNAALPPCVLMYIFNVSDGRLNCHVTQRSVDSWHGLPWNIAQSALMVHILAKMTNLTPGDLLWCGTDVHLYTSHLRKVDELLSREPLDKPHLKIDKELHDVTDLETLLSRDFEVMNYESWPAIQVEMVV